MEGRCGASIAQVCFPQEYSEEGAADGLVDLMCMYLSRESSRRLRTVLLCMIWMLVLVLERNWSWQRRGNASGWNRSLVASAESHRGSMRDVEDGTETETDRCTSDMEVLILYVVRFSCKHQSAPRWYLGIWQRTAACKRNLVVRLRGKLFVIPASTHRPSCQTRVGSVLSF